MKKHILLVILTTIIGFHCCAQLLAVGVISKKVQLVDPIPLLYLSLPKNYPIPVNIQEILVRVIQGTPKLEEGYARYSVEKRQLTGWLISTYKSAIETTYAKHQEEVNRLEQLLANTGIYKTVEDCRLNAGYWKDSYYRMSQYSERDAALPYKIYRSILDVLIQDDKAKKILTLIDPLNSELAAIEEWSTKPAGKSQHTK